MSATSDQLVDRRRMQRRLSLWRVLAFAALAIAVLTFGWRAAGLRGAGIVVPHIARLSIGGLIVGDDDTIKLIDGLADSKASGVLVDIGSPGGTVTGSERIYKALRRLSAKKPTVAVVKDLAASGAYIAALGTDQIVAEDNSLVGSIGVLFQFPNFSGALDKIGVKVETMKSSPLKASPNGLEPTTPEARAAIDALVVDTYGWFKGLVKSRRNMSDDQLAAVVDGRVFTGRQGLALHLVDTLGDEQTAIKYLHDKRNVPDKLPVYDWKKKTGFSMNLFGSTGDVARFLGLGSLAGVLDEAGHLAEVRSMEGLVAVWEPSPGT